ncbi:hypothetical protein VSR72_32420 [Paraburkholderia sp. JHI869]
MQQPAAAGRRLLAFLHPLPRRHRSSKSIVAGTMKSRFGIPCAAPLLQRRVATKIARIETLTHLTHFIDSNFMPIHPWGTLRSRFNEKGRPAMTAFFAALLDDGFPGTVVGRLA